MIYNGVDLAAACGVHVVRRDGPGVGGETSTLVAVPGSGGAVRTGGVQPAGEFLLELVVVGESVAQRKAYVQLLLDLVQEPGTWYFPDRPDRQWSGHLQRSGGRVDLSGPALSAREARVVLQFALPRPYAVARTEEAVALASGVASAELGRGNLDAPARVEVLAGGVAVDTVRVRVLDAAGVAARSDLTWTGPLAVGSTLVLDGEAQTASVVTGGVAAVAVAGLDAGAFPVLTRTHRRVRVDVASLGLGIHAITVHQRPRWQEV